MEFARFTFIIKKTKTLIVKALLPPTSTNLFLHNAVVQSVESVCRKRQTSQPHLTSQPI